MYNWDAVIPGQKKRYGEVRNELTIKLINTFFEPFWESYRKIPTSMRVVSQSKKLAKAEFMKLSRKTQERLLQCLEADIRARTKQLKH